MKQREL